MEGFLEIFATVHVTVLSTHFKKATIICKFNIPVTVSDSDGSLNEADNTVGILEECKRSSR